MAKLCLPLDDPAVYYAIHVCVCLYYITPRGFFRLQKTNDYMDVRKFENALERRTALEKNLDLELSNIGSSILNEEEIKNKNCENLIGSSQIPLGVAGPVKINNKNYYIPLATTEGALVASVSRGCKAILRSGGALSVVEKIGITRGPVFKIKNLLEKNKLEVFLKNSFSNFKKISSETSKHLRLTDFKTNSSGNYFYVRFMFDPMDAMGMNMATIAVSRIVKFIEEKTKIKCISVSGNYCVDKKPSWMNFIEGRGYKVWSEVVIKDNDLKNILKTNAKSLYEVWQAKCMVGSIMSGSLGFNAQFANVVAAIFIATGQDPAHIVEGSLGVTTVEVRNRDLYISVYLPSLVIGTVGGGTALPTQKEAFSILGIRGGDNGKNSLKFAEIISGAVLAGEISLLASLSEGTLGKAHQQLGRGKEK